MKTGNALAVVLAMAAGGVAAAQVIVDDSGTARDGKVGYWSSLVAGGGDVAISYYCEDDHAGNPPEMYTLRFAWRSGSEWRWTTVDQGAGSHSTMFRGADGQYRIAYDTWAGIGFAEGSGLGWATGLVDIDASKGPTNMSMTQDSQGRPHLGYMYWTEAGQRALRYTRWDGARWVNDGASLILNGVWTPTIGFSNTWLQLDHNDVPHAAYARPTDAVNAWGPVRYATLRNGVWTHEDLGLQGADPTLAIGPDNQPRMVFNSDAGVTYAYRDGSGWHFEDLVVGESASGPALALSDTGEAFATFGMTAFEDQYLARRGPGGWVVERFDGDGTGDPHVILGRYGNAIDVDEAGTPHVSYLAIDIYGPTHRCDLKYFGDGGTPACVRVLESPLSATVCGGQGAEFRAGGASSSPLAYAWEWMPAGGAWMAVVEGFNSDPASGGGFTAAGASGTVLTLGGGIVLAGPAEFRCVLSADCGSATTASATLTVGVGGGISEQPASPLLCQGFPAAITVGLEDPSASVVWERWDAGLGGWTAVVEGQNHDLDLGYFTAWGVTSPTVTMSGFVDDSDPPEPQKGSMRLRCRVAGTCGEATSDEAVLTIVECCPADFNMDGFLDFFDYDDFVGCFETGVCPPGRTADFNGDGFADFFDYDEFVGAFEQGC